MSSARHRSCAADFFSSAARPICSQDARCRRATKSEAREWLDGHVSQVLAVRRGDVAALRRREMPSLGEVVDEYLVQHVAEENTKRVLRQRLRYATEGPALDGNGWKTLPIDRLNARDVGIWRARLPERSAWHIHKALRHVLHYAVRVDLLTKNPASAVPNPEPKRREVPFFAAPTEVAAVAEELASPIPGLRRLDGAPSGGMAGARARGYRPRSEGRPRPAGLHGRAGQALRQAGRKPPPSPSPLPRWRLSTRCLRGSTRRSSSLVSKAGT